MTIKPVEGRNNTAKQGFAYIKIDNKDTKSVNKKQHLSH